MTLPYPFTSASRKIDSVTMKNATSGTLADTRRAAEAGENYQAVLIFIAGSIESLDGPDGTIEGKEAVKNALRDCPWGLAEWIAFQSLLRLGASDEVDMEFICPRCGASFFREDDLVKVSALEIAKSEEVPVETIPLSQTVEFIDLKTKEVTESVSALTFRLPTLGDCIRASGKMGPKDTMRLQWAVWVEAIVAVNSLPVDSAWRGAWGMQTFEKMSPIDARAISVALGKWAIDNTVPSICRKCGKEYRAEVPVSGFFASALGASTS
jgi:hypothetical protein